MMADAPARTVEPRPWQWGIAPHYIGLFLWIVYLDQLAVRTLPVGGLAASVSGVAIGGMLAFLLLFYAPAMWGVTTRRPVFELAQSTFGTSGAKWFLGVLLGLVHVAWFAAAIGYGVDFTFRGLISARMLDARYLQPLSIAGGWSVRSPLFLITAAVWCVATAVIGVWAVKLIAALMNIYPIFPSLALGGAMLWAVRGLMNYHAPGIDPVTAEVVRHGEGHAVAAMVQFTLGFFATAGVLSADWGAGSRDARDVRLGGLVGVAFASFILATLALVTVAGAQGLRPAGLAEELDSFSFLQRARAMRPPGSPVIERAASDVRTFAPTGETLGAVFQDGIGGWPGGLGLMIFGLGSMAPAVYAGFAFGQRFASLVPRVSRPVWTLIGALVCLPLIALNVTKRLDLFFGVMGAVVAPIGGAIASDYVRHFGRWPGPRRGVSFAGLAAWLVGLAVGLAPLVGPSLRFDTWSRFQPATLYAFFASFAVYLLLALLRLEPRLVDSAGEGAVKAGQGSGRT